MKFIDTHCHLDLVLEKKGWTLETLLEHAHASEVAHLVNIGTNLIDSGNSVKNYAQMSAISLSVGIHPCEIEKTLNTTDPEERPEERLLKLIEDPAVCAVGETGLDFLDHTSTAEKNMQLRWFQLQAEWAKKHKKVLIIHCRNAFQDCFEILRSLQITTPILFHCFTGDRELAQKALDLGCTLSFSGILTFKNAKSIQEAAKFCPLNRIVLETDAPFLAPAPCRGQINHSGLLPLTAKFLAEIKTTSLEEIAAVTSATAEKFFEIGKGHSI